MRSSICFFLMICILAACQKTSTEDKNKEVKPIFFHDVYFYLKPNLGEDDIKEFEDGLHNLGTITTLIDYHIGVPAKTPRDVVDSTFQYSIITSFASKEDHDKYQVDPIHDAFRNDIKDIVDSVRIYDSLIRN